MSFLDNSGDIILDAVLTDAGRARLARGDGSFQIAKFAFGDDEINYTLYNKNHPSGSAYYDLDILQSPVLEAFTNNVSSMKYKLLSITRTNLLYLPTLNLNNTGLPSSGGGSLAVGSTTNASGSYFVSVDQTTETQLAGVEGLIKGYDATTSANIRVDQGLDTNEISPLFTIDFDLNETQYLLEVDNRLIKILDVDATPAAISFIDDDNIASYYASAGSRFVNNIGIPPAGDLQTGHVIEGPRGTTIAFRLQSSIDLTSSTYLFQLLGSTLYIGANQYYYIDTVVRITGVTTGSSIEVPIRIVKAQ